ncbi:MAG: catechol 2,3-dioxygenase-like lactoylglutathione lyase family enzyme [Paracoccaceae bacterium]|jgi:catechol 2,3-dioxygenase-like lactoylglutathione lyase family enzyme
MLRKMMLPKSMSLNKIALIAYLARDYDEAIAWFQGALGFHLLEDSDHGDGKRWVRMSAAPASETGFLIARAVGDQIQAVGSAAGGRVAYIFQTVDFEIQYAKMIGFGVVFEEAPRHEPYGTVAIFQDLYGNRWDLIEFN